MSFVGYREGRPLIVATNHRGYAAKRNILDMPLKGVRVERRFDVFKVLAYLHYRAFGGESLLLRNLWLDFGGYPLVHLRDGISVGRSPWISSFQSYLPRWEMNSDRMIAWGLERMAREACRALIAQSRAAYEQQLHYTRMKAPQHVEAIQGKLHVLHPPQKPLFEQFEARPAAANDLTFIFVGHDFFRKGGREILRAFDRLLGQGASLRLIIVSKLKYGDYASKTTAADREEALRIISRHPGAITLHERLPHAQVLELFKVAHVGLLPTWSETYGYSVLEAQAAGCPVITTGISALQEINDEQVGWVIKVPKHPWKAHALWQTDAQRAELSAIIEDGVYRTVEEILNDRGQIERKGRRALARIREEHDPHQQARKLEAIYEQALAG